MVLLLSRGGDFFFLGGGMNYWVLQIRKCNHLIFFWHFICLFDLHVYIIQIPLWTKVNETEAVTTCFYFSCIHPNSWLAQTANRRLKKLTVLNCVVCLVWCEIWYMGKGNGCVCLCMCVCVSLCPKWVVGLVRNFRGSGMKRDIIGIMRVRSHGVMYGVSGMKSVWCMGRWVVGELIGVVGIEGIV